jgi:hypothetical protein
VFSSTPSALTAEVLSFYHSVCPGMLPRYVAVQPLEGAEIGECFPLVDKLVAERNGSACYGWRIWEWPRVMIEAEFHAVWMDPEGALRDHSPTVPPENRILFLQDFSRRYVGLQVNNIRRNLSASPLVDEFFECCDALFENRGARALMHGTVMLDGQDAREFASLQRRKMELQYDIVRSMPRPAETTNVLAAAVANTSIATVNNRCDLSRPRHIH